MIECSTVEKSVIRNHYNLTTLFYRLLWGKHIHHGLWDGDESPAVAQLNLTRTLAREARITGPQRVLDVGCGMGGSSIHLATTHGCDVTGITLSRFQQWWASCAALLYGVGGRAKFQCQDAEHANWPNESFDTVWSIECTEHLFDKPAFFQNVGRWLKPGGRVAICAWLANTDLTSSQSQQIEDVCEGFFCPSLGTSDDYIAWLRAAGLEMERCHDWSERVAKTWEICLDRVRRSHMPRLAPLFGANMVMFVDRFETILNAYRTRAMRYGCFIARKP